MSILSYCRSRMRDVVRDVRSGLRASRAMVGRLRLPLQQQLLPLLPLVAFGVGCGADSLQPVPRSGQADLYWDLELNHHAVTLSATAPYDTLPLVATPRNFREEPLAGLPAARYVSSDPERVIVGTDGVLRAVAPTSQPVAVVATLTAGNLKHVDTVLVSVVDNPAPPVIASFSIHPLPPDSAKVGMSNDAIQSWDTLPARLAMAGGDVVPVYGRDAGGFVPVYFRSSDTTVAEFIQTRILGVPGVVRGVKRGVLHFYGSTTVFGQRLADTLEYRVGWPAAALVRFNRIGESFTARESDITITIGGVVGWAFVVGGDADTLDITFADAALSGVAAVRPAIDRLATLSTFGAAWCNFSVDCDSGGNLLLVKSGWFSARYFPVPGTYEYHSARTALGGRVTVVDDR